MPRNEDIQRFDDGIFSDAVKSVLAQQRCPAQGCGGALKWRLPDGQDLQVGQAVTFIGVCKSCGQMSEIEIRL